MSTATKISPDTSSPPEPRRVASAGTFLTSVGGQNLSLIGALVLVLGLFGILNDNYLSVSNMQVIAEAATITG
ncbi:ABC transporter permease, partial [Kitasatospora indigofera]